MHSPYLQTFARTLWIAVATVALCAPLGFAIALVLDFVGQAEAYYDTAYTKFKAS